MSIARIWKCDVCGVLNAPSATACKRCCKRCKGEGVIEANELKDGPGDYVLMVWCPDCEGRGTRR